MSNITEHIRSFLSLAACCALVTPQLRAIQRAPEPCDRYRAAVEANPSDLGAAAGLGRCSVNDYEMIAPDGDSTRLTFRSSWSDALRALRHAVELDPAYGPAYRPLFTILFAEERDGCRRPSIGAPSLAARPPAAYLPNTLTSVTRFVPDAVDRLKADFADRHAPAGCRSGGQAVFTGGRSAWRSGGRGGRWLIRWTASPRSFPS